MRCVICRVNEASVTVNDQITGAIQAGLLVYVCFLPHDNQQSLQWMAKKLPDLRIFPDEHGKMNLSVSQINGSILLIPNFTLAGKANKGTRPNFMEAAKPDLASPLFDQFFEMLKSTVPTERGVFGAHMIIHTINDGPVTLVINSPESC